MSVTGIAYRNASVNYLQQGRAVNSGKPDGLDETCAYGAGAVVQEVAPTFVNQEIDPMKVDPRNASYEEIQAYNVYLVERGYLKVEDIDSFEHPAKDDKEKADYYSALQRWEEMQYRIGNMAGYSKAAKMREAWTNDIEEQDGTVQYLDGKRIWNMSDHMQLTSGLLGFGCLGDKTNFTAKYAADSTPDNPVVEVHMTNEAGKTRMVRVKVNEVDTENATELEMFAFLSHLDAQGKIGSGKLMESYQDLIYRAKNSEDGDLTSKNQQDFTSWRRDWRGMTLTMTDFKESALQHIANQRAAADDGVPYSYLAKDGIIDYKGVIFVCDPEHKSLCLGNMSDPKKCLHIPLSGGGSLVVNRDNLGDLAKAIGMFSPEDVNLILRAIAEDAKIQQMKQQIDDETSGLDIAENTGETGTEAEGSEISYVDTLTVGESKEEKENEY